MHIACNEFPISLYHSVADCPTFTGCTGDKFRKAKCRMLLPGFDNDDGLLSLAHCHIEPGTCPGSHRTTGTLIREDSESPLPPIAVSPSHGSLHPGRYTCPEKVIRLPYDIIYHIGKLFREVVGAVTAVPANVRVQVSYRRIRAVTWTLGTGFKSVPGDYVP